MRNNHRWTKKVGYFYHRVLLAAGTLAMLALALGAGKRWG